MPRFHLHLHNALIEAADEEGIEVPDVGAAVAEAIAGVRDFLAHEVRHGKLDLRGHVAIADEAGKIVSIVRFAEVIIITPP